MREVEDLQACLKSQIGAISPGTLVIAEEFRFGDWSESNRRIDLLGIDKEANFVVIELKRTTDGGHMELQALRYAAMISNFNFDNATKIYQDFLEKEKARGREVAPENAREELVLHLGWEDEQSHGRFGQGVKIVLASAEFSRELTTTVLWLIDNSDIDISCVKIVPHTLGEQILLDVQTVIPTPEAKDYQVSAKEKRQKERTSRKSRETYDLTIDGELVDQRLSGRALMLRLVTEMFRLGVGLDRIEKALDETQPYKKYVRYEGNLNSEEVKTRIREKDKGGNSPLTSRYFCEDEQLFPIDNYTFVLRNSWTIEEARDALQAFQELTERKIESSLLTGES